MTLLAALSSLAHADVWRDEVFYVTPENYIAASLATGGFPASFPAGVGTLDEPAIRSGLLLAAKVTDADGEVIGFATEQADVDFSSFVSHSTWSITIPGRGALFMAQDEDILPLFQILGEMASIGEYTRTYDPPLTLTTTLPDTGIVVGGTGDFEDARGTFREVDDVHTVSLATGALAVTDRLEITLKSKD